MRSIFTAGASRVGAACAVWVWVALWAGSAAAQGEPMSVVMRVAPDTDPQLVERVDGQLVDLPVSFRAVDVPAVAEAVSEAVEQAREQAEALGARVVVWFVADPALTAYVAEPAAQRLLVRELGLPAEGKPRSAQLEAAALVVRTAVRALASGGEIGVDEREVVRAAEPESEPALTESEPEPDAPLPWVEPAPTPRPRWRIAVGWQSVLDGVSPKGAQGARGGFALAAGLAWLGLRASVGLPAAFEQPDSTLELTRHQVEGVVGWSAWNRERVSLELSASLGLALFRTRAVSRNSDFVPTRATRTPVVIAGGEVLLRHWPRFGRGTVGWQLGLGADALPQTPELVVERAGAREVRERLYPVAPRATLALVARGY